MNDVYLYYLTDAIEAEARYRDSAFARSPMPEAYRRIASFFFHDVREAERFAIVCSTVDEFEMLCSVRDDLPCHTPVETVARLARIGEG